MIRVTFERRGDLRQISMSFKTFDEVVVCLETLVLMGVDTVTVDMGDIVHP